jgi:hypothetical protein
VPVRSGQPYGCTDPHPDTGEIFDIGGVGHRSPGGDHAFTAVSLDPIVVANPELLGILAAAPQHPIAAKTGSACRWLRLRDAAA